MTAFIRFRSCAIAVADFILGMFLEEDRPAHDHESTDYTGPTRNDGGSWWI